MRWLLLSLGLLTGALQAEPMVPDELQLLGEYPIEGMPKGNLSGLAWCSGALWGISDRDDRQLFRMQQEAERMLAIAEPFELPETPPSLLPTGMRMRSWLIHQITGNSLDFEGISCDEKGNRYLISESSAQVLQLSPIGSAQWLNLPANLIRQARASGMLREFNALFEGIAVDPAGERLWLAAERRSRGLVVLHRERDGWSCSGGCTLFSESGMEPSPEALGGHPENRDFADVAYYQSKLFTLERQAHRICRRNPNDGQTEKCWSFAAAVLTPERLYGKPYGMAEGLWIDSQGAWIGVDNGGLERADGESRPLIWRFAAPHDGWESP